MKYRLEFAISQRGGVAWEVYGNFETKQDAERVGRDLRRKFGQATRTRIMPAPDSAPTTPVPENV